MAINKVPFGYEQNSGKGRIRENAIYVGIVKKTDDVQKMGRIAVWVPEMGGDPEDERYWFTVSYASPFAGATNISENIKDGTDMNETQKSYGFWMVPPDINNQVLICFANGDTSRGFWFASIWQQNMNHMVPGIAVNKAPDGKVDENIVPPVTEYNKKKEQNYNDPERPVFTPLHNGLVNQGLYTDFERGISNTSARRESPSKVFGFLTPRGNTVHVDDNEDNEFIRFRTRGGAQVLISETTGFVYINSKDGNSWVEISDSGIDLYSEHSVSIRAQKNINLHADKSIIMDAGAGIYLRSDGEIVTDSGGETRMNAEGNFRQQTAGEFSVKSEEDHIRSARQIYDNTRIPDDIAVPLQREKPDIINGQKATTKTIVERMPSHEPWVGHPSKGKAGAPPEPIVVIDESSENFSRIGSRPGGNLFEPPPPFSEPNTNIIKTGTGNDITKSFTDTSERIKIGNFNASKNVLASIKEASDATNVDYGYMLALAETESGFDPNAKARTSSATGLYQFTDSTWNDMVDRYGDSYGIGIDDRKDPRANAIMGALYTKENQTYLESKGFDPNGTDLYMAHFLGAGGANRFLNAKNIDPNQPAYLAVSQNQARANQNIFYDNTGNPRTVQQVYDLFDRKVGTKSVVYAENYSDITFG